MIILSKNKKKGFSLAEIVVSALILVIASAGFFASFIAANRFINRSKRHMAAVNLARKISEELYPQVSADTWTDNLNNKLACPTGGYPCDKAYPLPALDADNPLNGFNPTATLRISLDGASETNSARQVKVSINWNE